MVSNTPSYYNLVLTALYLADLSLPLFLCLLEFDAFWDYQQGKNYKKKRAKESLEHIGYSFIIALVPSLSRAETLKEAFLLCYKVQASGNSPQFILLKPVHRCRPRQKFLLLPNILKETLRLYMLKHVANMYTSNIAHVSLLHISLTLQNFSLFFLILMSCHNAVNSYVNWNTQGCLHKQYLPFGLILGWITLISLISIFFSQKILKIPS